MVAKGRREIALARRDRGSRPLPNRRRNDRGPDPSVVVDDHTLFHPALSATFCYVPALGASKARVRSGRCGFCISRRCGLCFSLPCAFGAAFASAFGAAFASARRALSTGRGSPAIASDTRERVGAVLQTPNRWRLRCEAWSTSGWMLTSCGLVGTRSS